MTGEERVARKKMKAEKDASDRGSSSKNKKPKSEEIEKTKILTEHALMEFDKFCKDFLRHLTIEQMRRILEANGHDTSDDDDDDDAVVSTCQDLLFLGPTAKCPVCGGEVICNGKEYVCRGEYSEWSSCPFTIIDHSRIDESLNIPESQAYDNYQNPDEHLERQLYFSNNPFIGMTIFLYGRLSRKHEDWNEEIEKYGGTVANTATDVTCIVSSVTELDRGGSSVLTEALEKGIRVVSEEWLHDCIDSKLPLPMEAYNIAFDLVVGGDGIPLDKLDTSEEAIENIVAELCVYGKDGVHIDMRLLDDGGKIFEKDGIKYNCAFSLCNLERGRNDFCIIQLILVPGKPLNLYRKQGRIGDEDGIDEFLDVFDNVDEAITEFVEHFEDLTGNEFESWEREKQFTKKFHKFMPIDIDDGIDVRHGGLGQKAGAVVHSKLDSKVANFMKFLCSQEIYRYALMETGHDFPEMPIGMVTDAYLKRCESTLLQFTERMMKHSQSPDEPKDKAIWQEFCCKWFTLLPTTRPFRFSNISDVADHGAAVFESVRDINVASRLIGDMTGSTFDDPLFDRYRKLGCAISPVEKDSDSYKMIEKYFENTYEPVKVGEKSYSATIASIFETEVNACPSYNEIKRLPNKVLLWCGTRSSNLLRHLHKGFLPNSCQLPVPGYMFGNAIVCSDAAAEAARYGFTAIDRPEGFLILAIASLGENIIEITTPPEDTKDYKEKKIGVIGRGKKRSDESEHFTWEDDIKVPCGRLIPSNNEDSILDYDEYAVYDSQQVAIKFLVGVKYEEMGHVFDAEE